MNFDITKNASIVAALRDRCDTTFPIQNAKFSLASMTPTQRTRGDSKFQMSLDVNHATTRVAISWSAVYRMKVLIGTLIVANVEQQELAEAMLLVEAQEQFDLIDQKMLTYGSPHVLFPATAPGY